LEDRGNMPVAAYDQYAFMKGLKGGNSFMAALYRRTVNQLRRSFQFRAGPGKYELTILIEQIAIDTARIFDLEQKVMAKMEKSNEVDTDKENLILRLKAERLSAIAKLHLLTTGRDVFKALAGKQGYRNTMVRSKVMQQEMDIQTLNEDTSEGNVEDEAPVGAGTGSDV